MEEDKELNLLVLKLIQKCQEKKVVGINRVIDVYKVEFKFRKAGEMDKQNSGEITKVGDALEGMGDSITKTFNPMGG